MFKEWEDFVIAAGVMVVAVTFGKEAYKEYEKHKEWEIEQAHDWVIRINESYITVSDRLTNLNASPKARAEAYDHLHMMLEKEIEFYELNAISRTKALSTNNKIHNQFASIWK